MEDRTSFCSNRIGGDRVRGERLIKQRDSWFLTKLVKAKPKVNSGVGKERLQREPLKRYQVVVNCEGTPERSRGVRAA